jgi:anti-sigma regulatory factor (Ser/Thr protein kinase)
MRALPEPGEAFLHLDLFRLPALGTSVAEARRRVGELLDRWGVAENVLDDATLVVSELFTNALVHTDSAEITCRLHTTQESVYVAVADQGRGQAGPVVREPDAESGRGLMLVSALAQVWGVIAESDRGRTVWAVLNRLAGEAGADW